MGHFPNKKQHHQSKPPKKLADYFRVSVEYLITGNESNRYYLNEETAKLAQEMYADPNMRTLFHIKRNISPEKSIQQIEREERKN